MARLGVNLTRVAALRQLGEGKMPDPVNAVVFAEIGGADGIVCTLSEELDLLTERDLQMIRETVKTHLNLHIPPTDKMIALALKTSPDMVTLIPGKRPGSTEWGGLDVLGHISDFAPVIQSIREKGIVVSLLVEPLVQQVKAAAKAGADYVELHLGAYAHSPDLSERADQLNAVTSIALAAAKMEMGVAASQGLNYQNAADIAAIPQIEEINVGHALVARALWVGFENAVRDMIGLVR